MKIVNSLPWLLWLMTSQGMALGVGVEVKGWGGQEGISLCDLLGGEEEEVTAGGLQQSGD